VVVACAAAAGSSIVLANSAIRPATAPPPRRRAGMPGRRRRGAAARRRSGSGRSPCRCRVRPVLRSFVIPRKQIMLRGSAESRPNRIAHRGIWPYVPARWASRRLSHRAAMADGHPIGLSHRDNGALGGMPTDDDLVRVAAEVLVIDGVPGERVPSRLRWRARWTTSEADTPWGKARRASFRAHGQTCDLPRQRIRAGRSSPSDSLRRRLALVTCGKSNREVVRDRPDRRAVGRNRGVP